MIEYFWTVALTSLIAAYQAVPISSAVLSPDSGSSSEHGYSKVRAGESPEGRAERVKEGENFSETGTAQDAYERPFFSREGQAYQKTTDRRVEEALRDEGDFSVYQEQAGDEIVTKSDALEVQQDLDQEQAIFEPVAQNDSDMKKENATAIHGDRKGDPENNQTAMMSNEDYNKQFRDPFGKPRKDEQGDTVYQIDETLDKQQSGSKYEKQVPNFTKSSSNQLSSSPDKALIGDPMQQ